MAAQPPPNGTWVVVGASRGIGLEFVRQLLQLGNQVIAAVRDPITASQLWQIAGSQSRPGSCLIEQCDVTSEESIQVSEKGKDGRTYKLINIQAFAAKLKSNVDKGMRIENVVLNAGILQYPNRASEMYVPLLLSLPLSQ
jgi:NAD(P)-dependent dehydrogenase (short-subunit alcohol dehydrogenase family)